MADHDMYIYINIYNIKSNYNIKYNVVVLTQHAYKARPVSIFTYTILI